MGIPIFAVNCNGRVLFFLFFLVYGKSVVSLTIRFPLKILNIPVDEFDTNIPKHESFLMRWGWPASFVYCL